MPKQYKIYKRTVHEDGEITVTFGTEEDINNWKEESQRWIEEEFSVDEDSIEELEITSIDPNIGKILSVINEHIREEDDD